FRRSRPSVPREREARCPLLDTLATWRRASPCRARLDHDLRAGSDAAFRGNGSQRRRFVMSSTSLASVRCADIAPAAVSWLWEPYLARGKLAVLDGDPGTGKSFFTVDLAARVSSGAHMPCGGPAGPPASVLLLNAEDDARDTIRPRVSAAAGAPDRVRVL